MEWEVLYDDDFDVWFEEQEIGLQDAILAHTVALQEKGPNLNRPRVDTVKGSKLPNLKELRVQYRGDPWRILFIFDPLRRAILLVVGNKQADGRLYRKAIRLAEQRYQRHLDRMENDNGAKAE